MEADADHFKPLGDKIASYTRASASGKGKGKANGAAPSEDSDDAVVYEMYKVSTRPPQGLGRT